MVNYLKVFINAEIQKGPVRNFFTVDSRMRNLGPSERRELKEKLFTAEKNISQIRLLIVGLNIFVFALLMDKSKCIESLAWLVILSATFYSMFIVLFHPYRKYHVLLTSYFTSGTDAILITLWISATGGFDSPFYVLWYVSVLAIALRYTVSVTIRIALLYSIIYLVIIALDVDILSHLTEAIVRIGYLLLISALGGLLSKDTSDQIKAKLIIKKSKEEMKKREAQLQEAHNKLEDRVRERTRELNKANLDLQRINEDIDNFVYATSHDLKSPLLNLQSLITMVFDDLTEDPETNEIKNKILGSVERMKGAINHLSQVAKAQNEVYDDIEPIRFEEILKEVIADNEEIIKKARANIETYFTEINNFYYSRACIKSFLYNFITNAIKYSSPERGPEMMIKTEIKNESLILSVKDNGLGIDLLKNGTNLFTIFKRFHSHVEGAGIGLYMVKRIVEKNKGKIEVESELNKGTTFKIIFNGQKQII
jgi:signal transduction histidine kinase